MKPKTLPERLREIRHEAEQDYPDRVLEVMDEATRSLKESDITENALHTGETIPDFTLPNTQGDRISATRLLESGPLVINFYRGFW